MLCHCQDCFDGFFFCIIDKCACIYDDGVSLRWISSDFVSFILDQSEHNFTVDKVLWTAERQKSNLHTSVPIFLNGLVIMDTSGTAFEGRESLHASGLVRRAMPQPVQFPFRSQSVGLFRNVADLNTT